MDYIELDKLLTETVDKELLKDLDYYLETIRKNSRALASSLKRCFENAKKSKRFLLVYELGRKDNKNNLNTPENIEEYLEKELKDFFEKNDFMHYREFVRLLRACTIDVGGETSYEIKTRYKEYFSGKRLIAAYRLGRENSFNHTLNLNS